jgi:hypothetical protein
MTRLEANRAVVEEMAKRSELKQSGTYEEMVIFNLGTIATMLTDISKSLAIIADKAESEDKEEQLKKLKEELDYAKFNCALPTIMEGDKNDKDN